MRFHHQDISICLFLLGSAGILYLISSQFQLAVHGLNSSWVYRLCANLLGYGVVFIPGYIIIKYIHRINYIDRTNKGCLWPIVRQCIYGNEGGELIPSSDPSSSGSKSGNDGPQGSNYSFSTGSVLLFYCFGGLQGSYLIWGLLQEKIMTQTYGDRETFTDSQFLVFINRVLALAIAWVYLAIYERGTIRSVKEAPLYKYSYCAFSNIMSSWFQYEALKFVSFPTQVNDSYTSLSHPYSVRLGAASHRSNRRSIFFSVLFFSFAVATEYGGFKQVLAKSCKIIPVMLMGKVISRQTYEFYEYLTAVLMSLGMVLFLSGSSDYIKTGQVADVTTSGLSGLLILTCYMVFDSFTSNWQSELFRVYKVSSVRMMAGVNLFSCLLTGVSLVQQGTMSESIKFMFQHNDFAFDCAILSICSAIGQLFIYYTIETFGAVVFIIIMTIRQALAVLLSTVMYSHPISAIGIIGVTIVFVSVFLRTYCAYRLKQIRRNRAALSSSAMHSSGTKV